MFHGRGIRGTAPGKMKPTFTPMPFGSHSGVKIPALHPALSSLAAQSFPQRLLRHTVEAAVSGRRAVIRTFLQCPTREKDNGVQVCSWTCPTAFFGQAPWPSLPSALWSDKVGLSGISGFTMDIPMRSFVISFFRFELMENAYGTMFFGVYIPGAFVADKVSGNSAPCLSECQGTILDFSILG